MTRKCFYLLSFCLLGVVALADSGLMNKYYLPEIQSDGVVETYVGIVNPTADAADVDVYGFAVDGTEIGKSTVVTTLAAAGKAWFSVAQAFPDNFQTVAWIQVGGSKELEVFAEIWGDGTRSAYWASKGLFDVSYMPHVAKNTAQFSTYLAAVNGTADGVQTAARPKPSGSTKLLAELGTGFGKSKFNVLDKWSDLSNINWVELESNARAVSAMEYFTYNEANRMASLGLDSTKGKTLRFLHIATNTATFWTGMVYINVAEAAANITETYYDAAGTVLSTRNVTLDPNDKVTLLFDAATQDPVPAGSAWLEVTSDQDLVGYELFGSANGIADDNFAGLQGNYSHNEVIDYPHFSASDSMWVGLVAVNLGTTAADITFHLMGADGTELATQTVTGVAAKQKITRLGADLFPGVANGAWVRATTSGSDWAGFLLWGDHNGAYRMYLSGMVAALRRGEGEGPGPVERTYVQEEENNNSYANAQVLTPVGGGWNINVVGELDQSDVGTQVNNYGSGTDDIEDVFMITLTEPTTLIIATTAAISIADIDLFVLSSQVADGNWFDAENGFDTDIAYSATAAGYESVVREFQPGTYYIMVSLFEGGVPNRTDYGLLVSSHALLLETFNTVDDMNDFVQTIYLGTDDADEAHNWYWSEGPQNLYGACAAQAGSNGTAEISWIVSQDVSIPDYGVTVVDYEVALMVDGAVDETASHGLYIKPAGVDDLEFINGYGWNPQAATTDVQFEGATVGLLGYLKWVQASDSTFDYTFDTAQDLAFAFLGTNETQTQIWDNIRVFNIATEMPGKAKANPENSDGKAHIVIPSRKQKFSVK